MWMEERAGKRINQMRVEEAERTGAEILATVCPLCFIQLDSAIKVLNLDDRIRVMDILELVGERMASGIEQMSMGNSVFRLALCRSALCERTLEDHCFLDGLDDLLRFIHELKDFQIRGRDLSLL